MRAHTVRRRDARTEGSLVSMNMVYLAHDAGHFRSDNAWDDNVALTQRGRRLSQLVKQLQNEPTGKPADGRVFSCLEELLAYYGRTDSDRDAILAPGRAPLKYGALWGLVHKAARELRRLGVGPTDRVAVVLPVGAETAAAVLAVATAAVCVPLNPNFTADEWQRYFGDLQIAALLTRADMNSASRGVAHFLGIPVIDLSPQPGEGPCAFNLLGAGTRSPVSCELVLDAGNDAFVLMTSGTTSRPKIVPLTHASVCASAYNAGAVLRLAPGDRLLNVLPLFHAHGLISGLLTALAAGSTVVCTPRFDPAAFFGWLTEFRPTWYTAVPSLHRAVLSEAARRRQSVRPCSLRVIRSASASLPPEVLGELESLFGVPVIETYGMTEAASQIAANTFDRRKPGSVGRPTGAEIAIIDGEGRRLAAGERGEISLRGPTITRGYDNDVAATESAFRDGWFRTGDLGYLDRDGYLFIVGRIKDVIKRGGQQVAPAEVEETLLRHPDVVEAAVFSVPDRRLGEEVAAAVVLRPDAQVAIQTLRNFALERLAGFKVPGLIRIVPEIPKTAAGKVKRDGLASALSIIPPEAQADRGAERVPLGSGLEQQLAKGWADLLEIDQIGVEQDVFALGANSITVTQMLSRVRTRFGVDLSFKDLFDAPTVAALATRIESAEKSPAAAASLSPGDMPVDAGNARLSFQQQRIHVLSRLDSTGYNYHVLEMAHLSGRLDVDALEAGIATICERHEVLRSTFHEGAGEPSQTVGTARPRLERLDLRPCSKLGRAAAIQRQASELLRQPFNLEKEPPLQARLLQLDEDDHALMIKVHHLITDGWSQRLFWNELEALYGSGSNGAPVGLPDLPVQYRHFVEWQRAWLGTRAAEEQRSYWRARLEGLTELPVRFDRHRAGIRTGRGARYPLKFSPALSRAIKSLSRDHRITLFMTLLAAFQCLLHRYTQHDDVAVGSVIGNRNQIQIENLLGMFANTIVLRTDLSGDPTFSEILQRVRQVTLDAYRNQDLPFEEVLRALQAPRSMDRNALFQVMFILQNPSPRVPDFSGLSVRFVDVDPGIARADLMLELIDADEELSGWFEYSTDFFEAATIVRMAAHLQTLLEAVVADPERRISRLPLLRAQERRRVLFDWNDTRTSFPRPGTFCERFARQAERSPRATAVSAGRVRLSYRELARRSSAIANRLSVEAVGPDVVVILLAKRGVDLLAAMIAVQRAGGAFLPLDPTIPAARLAQIIQHSKTPLVLAGQGCAAVLEKVLSGMPARGRPNVLSLAKLTQAMPRGPAALARPAPSSLAYVIYTSGSTGVPKGAMIEQRGLLNHLLSKISDLGLSASDVIAQTAPQSFDISVWQFLTALMVGGRVHIFADEEVRDPSLLVQRIEREGVTVLQIVPALLRAILDRTPNESSFCALSRLRWLICIGEALAPDLCRNWLRHFPGVPLVNAYGPAECSDTVATHRLTALPPASLATVPIGRAIANSRLYVLDAHLQPMPIGVPGELCVGGTCVGRGYLNDPEQTRRSFLRDPFSHRRGARLYRTGDLARWHADGTLDFVGRVDHQVKIRGYRIELEEIEHVLVEHPDVQAAVVLVRDDRGGEARLVAHIVAASRQEPEANELRDFLKTKLPEYMIPTGFIFLDRMPMTAHGKVDRSALARIRQGLKVVGSEFVAPRNSTEVVLASIWADLLMVEHVGVFDNFFALGGHSLLAGRVLARVASAFGVSLPLRTLFEASTVAALARRVNEARETQSNEPALEIARVEQNGPQPVSIVQEQVLRIEQDLPGLPQFNLPFAYRLQGPLNVPALDRSLVEVVRRHDSLRTRFAWADQLPVALVAPAEDIHSCLVFEDLAARTPTGDDRARALLLKKAELEAEQEALTQFDLKISPLLRTRLLRVSADDHVLLLILHHSIVDGWSIGVFMEEVSDLYAAFAAGRKPRFLAPALQFSDFARWQRHWTTSGAAARQLAHWKRNLRNAPSVFPTNDSLEDALLSSPVAHEPIRVPKGLVARLSALSHRRGGTLFMTLLAGFKTLLLARSGCNDVCVATAMANRSQLQTERMIGPLSNITLIRTRIDADLSFHEALSRVRDSVLEAYARQDLPFDILAARLAEEDGLDPASLMQVFFVLQSAFRPLKLPDVTVRSFAYPDGQRVLPIDRTWLSVMLKETPSGIAGSCTYKSDLFEPNTIRSWIADYTRILAKAAANPETPLGRVADR
jgi:amino acid adenylation domain-containing protein